jgi:hypothetical protein
MSETIDVEIQSKRDSALAELSEVVDEARYKSLGDGRIRDAEKERVRLKYLRLIIQAQSERRKILADKEIIELKERIEKLESELSG